MLRRLKAGGHRCLIFTQVWESMGCGMVLSLCALHLTCLRRRCPVFNMHGVQRGWDFGLYDKQDMTEVSDSP